MTFLAVAQKKGLSTMLPSMTNPLHLAIRHALTGGGRYTQYQSAQIVGAETDEPLTVIQTRHGRWAKGKGLRTLEALQRDLDALGYEVCILKKP